MKRTATLIIALLMGGSLALAFVVGSGGPVPQEPRTSNRKTTTTTSTGLPQISAACMVAGDPVQYEPGSPGSPC